MIRLFHLYPYNKHQISQELLNQLSSGDHPYAKFKTYPKPQDGISFDESLFIDNFLDVAGKYLEVSNNTDFNLGHLLSRQMICLNKLMDAEKDHKEELEALAVKIVTDYFNLNDDFDFDAKIAPTPMDVSNEMQDKPKLEKPNIPNIDNEVEKRKIVNAIQQGAALKTSRLYEMYRAELDLINPQIFNLTKELIEISYLTYYLSKPELMIESFNQIKNNPNLSEEMQEQVSSLINAYKLKFDNNRVTLYARGSVFITLLHELIKGTIEVISLPSMPKDKATAEYVIDQADNLYCEHFGIILGPKMWESFNNLVRYEDEEIKSLIFSRLFSLPTNELLNIFKKLFNNISLEKNEEEPLEIPEVQDVISKLKHDIYVYNNESEYYEEDTDDGGDDIDSLFA